MTEEIKERQKYIKMACGRKQPDLVLKNGRIINVFTGTIETTDLAISDGMIIGTGEYSGKKEIDLKEKYVAPGLIDGHVHIESSMLTPTGFAGLIMPKGTTTVIADPHEIANVCGLDGIKYMIEASGESPLDVFIMLPSCVPSTDFENSGAILEAKELLSLIHEKKVIGLGEMMNYPGVCMGNESVHHKLLAFKDRMIDGHAPGVSGKELNGYVFSGIKTDHECVTAKELEEKIAKGMYIHLREGSATKDVLNLASGVTDMNSRWCMFCTDDKHPTDIAKDGHINYNLKLAVREGINPIVALQMGTINTAVCYGLKKKGAIAPGYDADLVIFDDLLEFKVNQVYKKGVLVAEQEKALFEKQVHIDEKVHHTVHIKEVEKIDLTMPLKSEYVKVIRLMNQSILTKKVIRKVDVKGGAFQSNPKVDILKLAVIERHKESGNIGMGLVEGYGLKNGAIGLTIAHDSHNAIVIGDNDKDMKQCVRQLNEMTGGICIVSKGRTMEQLPLEVGGLMTDAPILEVIEKLTEIEELARNMGVPKGIDPMMTLAFLALPVIPELKVTDIGLFDADAFKFVEVEA